MNSIVKQNVNELVDRWLEAESSGVKFPVPFEIAWQIAGYSRKDSAKRKLPKRLQGKTFHVDVETVQHKTGASKKEIIHLSCDAFKHLCLMAETEQGDQIRQYFIEAEKKWRLVEKHHPEVSDEIEKLRLQAEISRNQASMMSDQLQVLEIGNAIVTMHGAGMLALIQGRPDAVVHEVEKVTETIICKDGRNVSFEGKSLAELGRELGFKTGSELETWLKRQKADHLICQGMRAIQAPYVPTENVNEVKRLWSEKQRRDRQLNLGE